MLAEDALDQCPEPCTDILPQRPVDRNIAPHIVDQLTGYSTEGFVAQHLHRAVVGLQRIVEGQFVIGETELLATGAGARPHLLCKLYQFLNDLRRPYSPILVAAQDLLQHLR